MRKDPGNFWNIDNGLLELGGCSWICNSLIFINMYISQAEQTERERERETKKMVRSGSNVALWDSSTQALGDPSFLIYTMK